MSRMKKKVEILYFDGCPTWQKAIEHVRQVVAQEALQETVTIETVRVETDDQARRLGFLGSPSVRVDGHDVDPSSRSGTDFGLQCRVYQHGERMSGVPPVELIRNALVSGDT